MKRMKPWLTTAEAAVAFHRSKRTIRLWIHNSQQPDVNPLLCIRVQTVGRERRYSSEDLDRVARFKDAYRDAGDFVVIRLLFELDDLGYQLRRDGEHNTAVGTDEFRVAPLLHEAVGLHVLVVARLERVLLHPVLRHHTPHNLPAPGAQGLA